MRKGQNMTKDEIFVGMKAMLGDDQDLLNEIYQDYLAVAKQVIDEAHAAEKNDNLEAMRRAAHTLKGCSANLGAEPLRELALDWENAAKTANVALFRELRGRIEAEFSALGVVL